MLIYFLINQLTIYDLFSHSRCENNPCENGATCSQKGPQYTCTCAPGWSGKLCDVEMVSCKDASLRKGKYWNYDMKNDASDKAWS